VCLHPLRGEAPDPIGGDDQGGLGAQGLPVRDGLDTGDVTCRGAEQSRGSDPALEFGSDLSRAFDEAGVGLFTGDDVAVRAVEGGGDLLPEQGGLGVD
jgi:hypothetical protein